MAKRSIKEVQAMANRGVGFGNTGNKSATIELTPDDVAALNVASDKHPETSSAEPTPPPEPKQAQTAEEPQSEDSAPDLNVSQIQQMITQAIASTNEAHQRKIEELERSHQEALQQAQAEADEKEAKAKSEAKDLQRIISTLGLDKFKGEPQAVNTNAAPDLSGQMTVMGTGSEESRRFKQLSDAVPFMVVMSQKAGQVRQRDTRALDEYLLKNKDKVRDGLEAEMREAGFLQGSAVTNAITDVADIPSLAFEYLSAMMRMTHFPDLIHWQFANYQLELGTKPGLVIAVPRFDDIAAPASFSDVVLTPGTRLNTDANPVLEKDVNITLQELGLGKDATNTVIGLSTFVSAYSMHNLEQIIVNKLGRHWQVSKDMGLYEQWFTTDYVVYNDNGNVTTTPTDLDTNDDGRLRQNFLINLRARLKALQTPTYRDGCYGLSVNPTALAQFMEDKSSKERDDAMAGMDLVGQMLANETAQQYGGEVSGYRGKYDGFHFFEQNVYGIGANGEPGSQNVTLGAGPGSTLMDSSFAFGPNTIAWAEGLPVEIRKSTDNDFQRQDLMTWYAHGAPGALNVKNDATTGEQLRVVEIRTPRTPV